MKKFFLLVNFSFLLVFFIAAQDENFYYENANYNEDIKTVLMFREGFELSNPVLELGEEISLVFKFDDLSGEIKDYYYTIIHCDANWNESFLLQADYLEGFPDNPLDDFEMSFNTTFSFVHIFNYVTKQKTI